MTAILQDDEPDLLRSVPGGVREVVSHCLEKEAGNRSNRLATLGSRWVRFLRATARARRQRRQSLPRHCTADRCRILSLSLCCDSLSGLAQTTQAGLQPLSAGALVIEGLRDGASNRRLQTMDLCFQGG